MSLIFLVLSLIPDIIRTKPRPFKFANFLAFKPEFLSSVESIWSNKVEGYSMFSVASKLKLLKKPMRKLKFSQGDLAASVKKIKEDLCKVQSDMEKDPPMLLLGKKKCP